MLSSRFCLCLQNTLPRFWGHLTTHFQALCSDIRKLWIFTKLLLFIWNRTILNRSLEEIPKGAVKDMMIQEGGVEETLIDTTCMGQMSFDTVPKSFLRIGVSDMCQENVKSQDFSGVFLKNEDSQKCPYICYSKTLLCYYAMR